jgi:hypothetical protein
MVSFTGLTSVGGGGGRVTPFPPSMVVGFADAALEVSEAKAIADTNNTERTTTVIFIATVARIQQPAAYGSDVGPVGDLYGP